MARARRHKRGKKLCPDGVRKECLYCIQSHGPVWLVLDPQGEVIDETSERDDGFSIAEGYIAQCRAAESGYTGTQKKKAPRRVKFKYGGRIRW